jgi:integrase/recombinase XerD
MQSLSISIYLDKRRSKANGKFPVKLRLFVNSPRIQKLYPTDYEFSEKEFDSIWNTSRPRAEFKDARNQLKAIEVEATSIATKIVPFNLEMFERSSKRQSVDGSNLENSFRLKIESLKKRGQISTASVYELSHRSLLEFHTSRKQSRGRKLSFGDINADWLKDYEYYLCTVKGRSMTTLSMYVRALRTLFNEAIQTGTLEAAYYPFGKRKYLVPAAKGVKKAISLIDLKTLYEAEPQTMDQAKAKDFWFFSFSCSGMNVKDIALLRWKDIRGGKLYFIREKTKNTSKSNLNTIEVQLNDFALSVIQKYGNADHTKNTLIFPIVTESDSPEVQRSKVKNFTKYINQHIKKLAVGVGLPEGISTYWARHSFATISIRKGAPLFWLQSQLGHTDVKTTQNYVNSTQLFDEKSFSESLLEF